MRVPPDLVCRPDPAAEAAQYRLSKPTGRSESSEPTHEKKESRPAGRPPGNSRDKRAQRPARAHPNARGGHDAFPVILPVTGRAKMPEMASISPLWIIGVVTVVIAVAGIIFTAGRWVGKTDGRLTTLEKFLADMKADIEKIRDDMTRIFEWRAKTLDRNSPVRLNDLGHQIATDLEAESWAAKLAPSVLPEVQHLQDFQIEAFCGHYVYQRLTGEWPNRIAAMAYEQEIEPEGVRAVLRVVLRDELILLVQRG